MRAFAANLGNPNFKNDWWIKDFEVSAPEDLAGFISSGIFYIELYDTDKADKELVKQCMSVLEVYETRPKEVIQKLFLLLELAKSGKYI